MGTHPVPYDFSPYRDAVAGQGYDDALQVVLPAETCEALEWVHTSGLRRPDSG